MTEASPVRVELLEKRLSLVAALSGLNAEALKWTQLLGAIEMDILRMELEIGRSGTSEQLVRDLHGAETSAASIRTALSDCEERIAAAERQVDEVDRLLAAA
ncbi:MAG: hypothetical protein EOQ50_11680 [Mesorhizobium sp.]|uniref:hypothetical protein n=1 Tax=Mesorhizobium sp. TaxID=1871066 RepID=UPI000FE7B428|nr:hypothetical protein [Mesorhizobium sp.]RWB76111.1 MAG: hypothetical protein EOQ50_11680 [Mesorhizobium sp.]TJV73526.1 MAG: hypothetical protein E5X76_06310 [Mesorhizobium sp.]